MFHGGFLRFLLRPRLLFIMYIGISIIISLCIYLILSTYLSVHLPYLPIAISPILFVISPSISLFLHLYLSMSLYLILSRLILPCLIISYVWYFNVFHFVYLHDLTGMYRSGIKLPLYAQKLRKRDVRNACHGRMLLFGNTRMAHDYGCYSILLSCRETTYPSKFLHLYKDVAGTNQSNSNLINLIGGEETWFALKPGSPDFQNLTGSAVCLTWSLDPNKLQPTSWSRSRPKLKGTTVFPNYGWSRFGWNDAQALSYNAPRRGVWTWHLGSFSDFSAHPFKSCTNQW